jgi:hypothetical protein
MTRRSTQGPHPLAGSVGELSRPSATSCCLLPPAPSENPHQAWLGRVGSTAWVAEARRRIGKRGACCPALCEAGAVSHGGFFGRYAVTVPGIVARVANASKPLPASGWLLLAEQFSHGSGSLPGPGPACYTGRAWGRGRWCSIPRRRRGRWRRRRVGIGEGRSRRSRNHSRSYRYQCTTRLKQSSYTWGIAA